MKFFKYCLGLSLALFYLSGLSALPGRQIQYSANLQVPYQYDCADLDQNTGLLWFYKAVSSSTGFYLTRFTVDIEGNVSDLALCYTYIHPLPLDQDGGDLVFILAENETGKSVILHHNANKLFFTIIENGADIHTVVVPHTGISFPTDPLWRKVYCRATPDLVFISSLPNVWKIRLSDQTVNLQYTNLSASGYIRLQKFGSDLMHMSAFNYSSGYYHHYIVDLVNQQNELLYYTENLYSFEPEPIGEHINLAYRHESGDWLNLRWTYLVQEAFPDFSFNLLYYGGSTDSFNYTPMHSFDNVRYVGNNWWLGICTDYNNIPGNRRAGLFRTVGNSIHYATELPALPEIPYAKKIFTLSDNYYLTYHDAYANTNHLHLVDIAGQVVSEPDTCSVQYQGTVYPLGEECFYYVCGSASIHCYRLVEPSEVDEPNAIPAPFIQCQASPNPFRSNLEIQVKLEYPEKISLKVYDLKGRFIRSLNLSDGKQESWKLDWDGKDQSGTAVPKGIYLLKLQAGKSSKVQKVVKT